MTHHEQERRTRAEVHLHNGEDRVADHVDLGHGWAHLRYRKSNESWEVEDIPAQRIASIKSVEYDDD